MSRILIMVFAACTIISCSGLSAVERPSAPPSAPTAPERAPVSEPRGPVTETVVIPGTDIGFALARVAGGTFTMGAASGDGDEGPLARVAVSPFWMGVHEVRFEEYAAFRFVPPPVSASTELSPTVDAAARPSPPYEDPAHGMGKDGFPAVSMTQFGALHYAKWLSDVTGDFYRLPTEAEWEFACRAGGSSDMGESAWYLDNSGEEYHPVGTKSANELGLHDLQGNVAEWMLDQYVADYFPRLLADGEPRPAVDPWVRPTSLHPRTVRGGAYDDGVEALQCTSRMKSNLAWKRRDPQIPKSFWWNTDSPFVGFRLVRPVAQPTPDAREAFWALVFGE